MIDEGKNPNLYVRDMLNSLVAKNQAINGQINAYKVHWLLFPFEFDLDYIRAEISVSCCK